VLALSLHSFEDVGASSGVAESLKEILLCGVEITVCCAEGFEQTEDLKAIFDALLGVYESDLTAL
jgi:hypothetical protein